MDSDSHVEGAGTRIKRIFLDSLQIELPSTTTDLIDSGLLDSLALVTLLYEVEQAFAITFPFDALDIERLRTVERIATLVVELQQAQQRSSQL
jgi:acyl carrier protein